MNKKLTLELKRPDFDRSRLRVYYGNMGEIIAQQVLRKQGFEVWLPRPVADGKHFLRIRHVAEIDEDALRRRYDIHCETGSIKEGELSWEEYLSTHKKHIESERKRDKATVVFFGDQLNSFREYLKRLESESIKYYFDLVAKKDEKIYIIEVRSTKGALQFLKGKKLRGLLLAREYGFIPSIVTFDLKIEADNFKMYDISE